MVLTKHIRVSFWVRLSLFNFLLVAVMGVLMRYKICFEFSVLDQKHLQLAHSHFAFTGWVTQTLMVFMIQYLQQKVEPLRTIVYRNILRLNALIAYGTIVSFVVGGYNTLSIVLLVFTILIGLVFTMYFISDTKGVKDISVNWFRGGLFFMTLSTLGTFSLAYMMANKHIDQHTYLASIYWYLHFQYNGWFFFACVGLLLNQLSKYVPNAAGLKSVFYLFFGGCIISYILSVLWLNLAVGWIILAALGASMQGWAWIRLMVILKQPILTLTENKPSLIRFIFWILALAITIKLLLQLGSTIPVVSTLAFGFRPVVIAYLHLILLSIISVCLLLHIWLGGFLHFDKHILLGMGIVLLFIYINQLILGIQGIASFANYVLPYTNEILLGISVVLVLGISWMVSKVQPVVSD
jgi:hypothetical protein